MKDLHPRSLYLRDFQAANTERCEDYTGSSDEEELEDDEPSEGGEDNVQETRVDVGQDLFLTNDDGGSILRLKACVCLFSTDPSVSWFVFAD